MPLIDVQLSATLSAESQQLLMKDLSRTVADRLGKPESYMMVALRAATPLLMGGSPAPAALVRVQSVGTISPEQARAVAGAVSELLAGATGIEESRIYSLFHGVPGAMWAQGSDTFG